MTERNVFTAFVNGNPKGSQLEYELRDLGVEHFEVINGPVDHSAYHPGLTEGYGIFGKCRVETTVGNNAKTSTAKRLLNKCAARKEKVKQ